MQMIADICVGKNDEKITVSSFESFIATFLCLVSISFFFFSYNIKTYVESFFFFFLQIEENCEEFQKPRSFLNQWYNARSSISKTLSTVKRQTNTLNGGDIRVLINKTLYSETTSICWDLVGYLTFI
jgi:hypothetical protein